MKTVITLKTDLSGEVVIITGAARGIGRATAELAAAQGALVHLVDVSDDGEHVLRELRDSGQTAIFSQIDITDEKQVFDAVSRGTQMLGEPTVLVNNAGKNAYFDATTMSVADWDSVFAVDLKAAWLMSRAVLPGMKSSGTGSIVNISSIHSALTTSGMFPYAAAKSGLIGLTRSLALDCAPFQIRVNAVSPGFVRTQLVDEWLLTSVDPASTEKEVLASQPLGRMATPAEIANVICFLASNAASFVTGAEWRVDGGLGVKFA